ncbi:MAG: hypothetical protein V4812_18845 [Pseudomonadota bacterium]
MIRLNLKVVGARIDLSGQVSKEQTLYEHELDRYNVDDVSELVSNALDQAKMATGSKSLMCLRVWRPEVVISLFVDEEPMRAALHFNSEVIQKMGEAGASFDFDPYIYE